MASLVLDNMEYLEKIKNGELSPNTFKYRFLVEGDSWMHQSGITEGSLPIHLQYLYDKHLEDVLFVNISYRGETLSHMFEQAGKDFSGWLNQDLGWKFDAVLLSAVGNDFIDAASGVDAGKGILNDFTVGKPPKTESECVNRNAVKKLVQHADIHFNRLYSIVRNSKHHADIPIFLNSYDTPTARDAPAKPIWLGGESWLYKAYKLNNIPDDVWEDVTNRIFIDIATTIEGWVKDKANFNVYHVPTVGVLDRAAPNSTSNDADWLNEIHPNRKGWAKLAKVWHTTLKATL